jgi:PIN domain nuclease of toxin-antitoxin system
MGALVADTHTLVWYLLEPERLSGNAAASLERAELDGDLIYLSAISLVELCYLTEKGRVPTIVLDEVLEGLVKGTSRLSLAPVDLDISRAVRQIPREVVPDMPDRIIAATARHLGLPLVTHDQKIQSSGLQTIW